MSTTIANTPTLAATVSRIIFSLGTHTYTAVQIAGPSKAVIVGEATITAGGDAIQLSGGYVSLATNGLVHKAGSTSRPITTSKSTASPLPEKKVQLTLASTMMNIIAPSGVRQAGTKIIGGSTHGLVIGQQTLRFIYNGVVVESGSSAETHTYSLTNITQAATIEQGTSKSSGTSSVAKSAEESISSKALETISSTPTSSSPASTTAESTSSGVPLIVTETAGATSMPSKASTLRGSTMAWMAMIYLLMVWSAT